MPAPDYQRASQSVDLAASQDVRALVNSLAKTTGITAGIGTGLQTHQQLLDSLKTSIGQILAWLDMVYDSGSLNPSTAAPELLTQYELLTAATTAITLPDPVALGILEGSRIAVLIRQDGTGGREITWAAGANWATVELGLTTPDTCYLFDFVLLQNEDNGGALEWFSLNDAPKLGFALP